MTKFKRWFSLVKWSKLSRTQKSAAVVIVLVILAVATSAASSTGNSIPGASSKISTPSTVATKSSGAQVAKNTESTKSSTDSTKSQSGQTQANQAQVQAQAQQPTPRYYLVSTYGQGGRTYVIDSADATESQLTLIGKDLSKLFGSDDMARIGIYTDPSQAQIGANPAQALALQGDAATTYSNAYVAQFNINKSTGLKQFFVYLNGSTKEIQL